MRVCYPGARVEDISDMYYRSIAGSGQNAVAIVHVGTNNIRNTGSEELVTKYEHLIRKMVASRKESTMVDSKRECMISGILPTLNGGSEWSSRALGINDRVRGLCNKHGIKFIDSWAKFVGKADLYSKDGLHLSKKGILLLSNSFENACNQGN
jgi:lysophospholipase L1-like esterase